MSCCGRKKERWNSRDRHGVRTTEEFADNADDGEVGGIHILGRIAALVVVLMSFFVRSRYLSVNAKIQSMEFDIAMIDTDATGKCEI